MPIDALRKVIGKQKFAYISRHEPFIFSPPSMNTEMRSLKTKSRIKNQKEYKYQVATSGKMQHNYRSAFARYTSYSKDLFSSDPTGFGVVPSAHNIQNMLGPLISVLLIAQRSLQLFAHNRSITSIPS